MLLQDLSRSGDLFLLLFLLFILFSFCIQFTSRWWIWRSFGLSFPFKQLPWQHIWWIIIISVTISMYVFCCMTTSIRIGWSVVQTWVWDQILIISSLSIPISTFCFCQIIYYHCRWSLALVVDGIFIEAWPSPYIAIVVCVCTRCGLLVAFGFVHWIIWAIYHNSVNPSINIWSQWSIDISSLLLIICWTSANPNLIMNGFKISRLPVHG